MARRKYVQTFKHKCTITEETFVLTKQAPTPDELISVKAYYELNPDKDDRPERIKNVEKMKSDQAAAEAANEDETTNTDKE